MATPWRIPTLAFGINAMRSIPSGAHSGRRAGPLDEGATGLL